MQMIKRVYAMIFSSVVLLVGAANVQSQTDPVNQITPYACEVSLRVATYNIHAGTPPGMGCTVPEPITCMEDLARIGRVLGELNVDVVGLQEVDYFTSRSNLVDQTAVLAAQLNMDMCFGDLITVDPGRFGNATLSRSPILSCENTRLPSAPDPNINCKIHREPHECCTGEGMGTCDVGEQRGIQTTNLEINGVPFVFFNTHLQAPGTIHRKLQTQVIAGMLDATNGPVVLVGDMNAKPDYLELIPIKERLLDAFEEAGSGNGYTAPAPAVDKRIDYIFVSDDVEVNFAQVVTEGEGLVASDHLAVVADVVIPGPNQPPTAQCQDVTVIASANDCTATASIDAGSFDRCDDPISVLQTPPGPYGLGETSVTLDVDDNRGASDSCIATVRVIDKTPPVIHDLTVTPNTLWPPNHRLVPVSLEVVVEDACDPNPVCTIIQIDNSEAEDGKGDGATAPDSAITNGLTASLRAERAGWGSGRVYTLTVECADSVGNPARASVKVNVPHN